MKSKSQVSTRREGEAVRGMKKRWENHREARKGGIDVVKKISLATRHVEKRKHWLEERLGSGKGRKWMWEVE